MYTSHKQRKPDEHTRKVSTPECCEREKVKGPSISTEAKPGQTSHSVRQGPLGKKRKVAAA